ncbi:signal peptidase I [Aeoliella sp. SH292]|uniref:signal peptidase I n=1 Tax=Aeoliella sp. SH292 TaxID=3454464 RepID=UPI003F9A6150
MLCLFSAIAVHLVAWGLLLAAGLRWARRRDWTWRRLIAVTFVLNFATIGIDLLLVILMIQFGLDEVAMAVLSLVSLVLIPMVALSLNFHLSTLRAIQAWLPTLFAGVAMLGFTTFVIRPFITEPFVSPSNGMAPTLLGLHGEGSCSRCGNTNYFSIPPAEYPAPPTVPAICSQFHLTNHNTASDKPVMSDRFFIAKYLKPRRWDLLVFDAPPDPGQLYVQRVVGLPGESIILENGGIKVDGVQLDLPEELQGIEYLTRLDSLDSYGQVMAANCATPENPAVLGEGEYFVLGDFSAISSDSRFWEQGVPGHPNYAVPASNIRGVVTHRVWPLSRWKVLR